MKKITKVVALLLVAILALGICTTAYATTYKYVKTQTSGSSVKLRKSASTSSVSLGLVKDGTKVSYLGKSGSWSKISAGGITGYMLSSYLGDAVPSVSSAYRYVKTHTPGSFVKLRGKASTSSASLRLVKDGTKVSYLGKSGSWSKISVGGKTGYMLSSYLHNVGTGSSSTLGKKGPGVINKNTYLYKSTSTKSSKLKVLNVGAQVNITLVSASGNWGKLTLDGKTGYVPMLYVTSTSENSSGEVQMATADGIITGVYTKSDISRPPDTVTTKEQFWNAINYNLANYKTSFTIKYQSANPAWLPKRHVNLEYAYMTGITPSGSPSGNGTITFTVKYNDAGKVIAYFKNGTAISSGSSNAIALRKEVENILSKVKNKSTYEKIVYFHDYIVAETKYKDNNSSAYDVLVSGYGSCQGYAEAMGLLLSCADIENRLVWAKSKISGTGTHGFNKVKLDGNWYNVDCTVDDPMNNTSDRIKRDFLLVTDDISKQRYDWETKRYPASTTKNNWHQRNNLVAANQTELEAIIKKAISKGADHVSVWVENYNSANYKPGNVNGVQSFTTTGAAKTYSKYATAIYIYLK